MKEFFEPAPLVVQHSPSQGEERTPGFLYGSVPGERLIVGGFKSAAFFVGDELVVRMVLGASVVGFKAEVMEKMESPGPVYFLSFPERVERVDLRKSERMPVFIPVEVAVTTGEEKEKGLHLFQGALINLSDGGCGLRAKSLVRDIKSCTVSFALPGSAQVHVLECNVVSKGKKTSFGAYWGLAFRREANRAPVLSQVKRWVDMNSPLAAL